MFRKSCGNLTVRLFPTDVCIVLLFGALILEEEIVRKVFFSFFLLQCFFVSAACERL